MTSDGEIIECQLAEGGRLRTRFNWQGDRYAHRITLAGPEGEWTLLESVEGQPDDPWPPSPCFQQLSFQGAGQERVAMLVGMAGKSHWSMSVEVAPSARAILFDVACRISDAPPALGSSYLAEGYQRAGPLTALRPLGRRACNFTLAGASPLERPELSVAEDRLTVHFPPPATAPRTTRWKYRIALTERNSSCA